MEVIKNINNNVSLCLDSAGREVIAFGKGVGFVKPPQEIPLNKIERTFYNISEIDFEVIKNIPVAIMEAAIRIVSEVENELNTALMSTTTLALADHINFAIKRLNSSISLNMILQEDINQIYQDEMRLAYRALAIIYEETGIQLDKKEAPTIALHFINNHIEERDAQKNVSEDIIQESMVIIEKFFQISIDRESFNYSRFVTHIHYLLRRTLKNSQIQSENQSIFRKLKEEYPVTYNCSLAISCLFKEKLSVELSEEEHLYLMLHINRLCSRDSQNNAEI